jgi:hypothetical protein
VGIKFTNNAEGTLTAGLTSIATIDLTLTAGDGLLFPTIVLGAGNYFYATLVDSSGNREIIKVTEHQAGTDVFQTIVREQDDTTGIAFSIGDKVQLRLPKVILEEYRNDIASNQAQIITNDTDIATNASDIDTIELYQVLGAPSGLTMYIYNPTGEIPTGWSAKAGPADCLLAIAGGSNAYNVAGENLAGSWTPTGHVHTGPSHVHTMNTHIHTMPTHIHTTPSHSLSVAEMPTHAHLMGVRLGGGSGGNGAPLSASTAADHNQSTTSTGSGNAHSHGNTGSTDPGDTNATDPGDTNASGTANSGSSKEPSTDRPYAAIGLLIERD